MERVCVDCGVPCRKTTIRNGVKVNVCLKHNEDRRGRQKEHQCNYYHSTHGQITFKLRDLSNLLDRLEGVVRTNSVNSILGASESEKTDLVCLWNRTNTVYDKARELCEKVDELEYTEALYVVKRFNDLKERINRISRPVKEMVETIERERKMVIKDLKKVVCTKPIKLVIMPGPRSPESVTGNKAGLLTLNIVH